MRRVLVTGANGMLGQDLCPILEDEGYEVIETDIKNLDITNSDMVKKVISEERPDIVIHCAAYTNVDKAEEDYEIAHKINAVGTENLAKVCTADDITLVYISTDYVFKGNGARPYKPTDETSPLNNYGLTKYEGEQAVQKYCKKFYICRTSWLYGIHGKNFVETMISLANVPTEHNTIAVTKPELKVVDDQVGCPTWTVDLSNAIVKIINDKPYGIYHTCGGGCTSWYGFAKEIFSLANLDVNLKSCATEEFPRPAKRPKYSVMDNEGLCRPWQKALAEYMQIR